MTAPLADLAGGVGGVVVPPNTLPTDVAAVLARAAAADGAVAKANAASLGGIKDSLTKAKTEVADRVVVGMRASFASAIHRLWLVSIVVMLGLLGFTLLIPNIPLRSKNDMAPPPV